MYICTHSRTPAGLAWTNFHLPWPRDKTKRDDNPGNARRQNAQSGNSSLECDRIRFSNTELAGTWGSLTLAFGSALLLRLGLRTQEILTRQESDLRPISFFEWFGITWYEAVDQPLEAGTFFLSKELTVLDRAFLGLTESSAEGWVSECQGYQVGGGITFAVLIIAYVIVPGYVMYTYTRKYLTYKKNPKHQDLVVRLKNFVLGDTGMPHTSRADIVMSKPVPTLISKEVPTSSMNPGTPSRAWSSLPVTGSCFGMEPHGGGGGKTDMLNEIGMKPSGQVYGNMARDDDEEVQPSKRCESTVSTVLQRTKFHL